jgi:ribonuclease G
MKKEILINASIAGTRVAILENKKLVEIYVELPEQERMVGNIYKGVVENVFKGMGACFVDIGMEQNAFLRFSDIGEFFENYGPIIGDEEDLTLWKKQQEEKKRKNVPLVTNQEILVQVAKEPIGTKGARVTSEITLPGRFLVLVPGYSHVGVSRKIQSIRERRRLKHLARKIRPDGFGLIVRTVAEGKDEATLRKDLENLMKTWERIEKRARKEKGPVLLYKDMGMVSSIIRDLFTPDVDRVVVDSRRLYREIVSYLKDVSPNLVPRVELYRHPVPLFDAYDVEKEFDRCLSRRVWLKSGGYLLFDQTEALVAIDVNSGKYVSKGEQEEATYRLNLEAAQEIARQLRLRDLGGIIVIDFVDMPSQEKRDRLVAEFRRLLRNDRAKTSVAPISEFGLVEMTRERVRPSVMFSITEPCPVCDGLGHILSKPLVATKIEVAIRRIRTMRRDRRFFLYVHPVMVDYLTSGLWNRLRRMMLKNFVTIELVPDDKLNYQEFRIVSKKTGEDLTNLIKT